MTLEHPAIRRLIQMGLAYLTILALTGEFRVGSNAMFMFGASWIVQAMVTLWLGRGDERTGQHMDVAT